MSYASAWEAAERKCFDYLQAALGTIEGVHGYTPDTLPREMTGDEDDFFIWTFRISGGAVDVHRNVRTEIVNGCWHMDAEFMAYCVSDPMAKSVAGTVMGALPVLPADIEGVGKLYPVSYPTIERTTRSLVNNENAGQERVFFVVTIAMKCAFSNMEI